MKAFRILLISFFIFLICLSGVSSGKVSPTQKKPADKEDAGFHDDERGGTDRD